MWYKVPFVNELVTDFTNYFLVIIIVFIVTVAWRSTNIPDNWQVRAVYVFDRRIRRIRHIPALTHHTISSTLVESTQPSPDSQSESETETHSTISTQTSEEDKPPEASVGTSTEGESSCVRDERTEIIEKMDADTNTVRQRRLAFFQNRTETLIDPNEGSSTATQDQTDKTSQSSQSENTTGDCPECHNGDPSTANENNTSQDNMRTQDTINDIRIRLKYLNDDLKLVDGKLNEFVGDFKRRHFHTEIQENKVIKLIFNGQLLQSDTFTLQSYGLFDNCVVHCLIHQNRTAQEVQQENTAQENSTDRRNDRDRDLGNILIVLVCLLLTFAWIIRYNYPDLFTITSTIALVFITGLFTILSLGTFFPDQNVPNIEVHLR